MSFQRFYETWTGQLRLLMSHLAQAPRPPATDKDHRTLRQLVNKVMSHYADFFCVKSIAATHDLLEVFWATWTAALERSLHWITGWRPTTAFHVIYTESSIHFESHLVHTLRGLRTGDLRDLSPEQFRGVSELQCETVGEENAVTDELSTWQDSSSDLLSEHPNIDGKVEQLVMILDKADDLRLGTIRKVVDLLTPQQAVEFLIAVAQLQFGVHTRGLNHDRGRRNLHTRGLNHDRGRRNL